MYAVYCAVSLATLPICVMLGVAALSTTLAVRFFPLRIRCQYLSGGIAFFNEAAASSAAKKARATQKKLAELFLKSMLFFYFITFSSKAW